MKIVVKVGTQSILAEDGTPINSTLNSIVEQLAELQANKHHVVFVSSGAVGYGRSVAFATLGKKYGSSIAEKQLLASLGQPELMHVYNNMFKKHNILVSQLLLTKQDFHTRKHYLNISRVIHEILNHKNIMPIINENDSVSVEELMFTDNDELAGLIAALIDADKLIILSNVAGVYNGHPSDNAATLIPIIEPEKNWPSISTTKSTHGRGGMISKLSTARKASKLGITTHIAAVHTPNVIIDLVNNQKIGTVILPSKRQSNIKRWIAYSTEQKVGEISINQGLYEILQQNRKVISILPVGITACRGNFKKGDVVEIFAPNQTSIGIGLARYDSDRLQNLIGQKNKAVFIHYDHLHIF